MVRPRKPDTSSVLRAARLYKENLLGRNILLIGRSKFGECKAVELTFRKGNFRHLVGVKTVDRMASWVDDWGEARESLPDR